MLFTFQVVGRMKTLLSVVFVDFPNLKKFVRILIPEDLSYDAELVYSENINFFEKSDLDDAKKFVMLNRLALLNFWYNGFCWCFRDVSDMIKSFKKVIN